MPVRACAVVVPANLDHCPGYAGTVRRLATALAGRGCRLVELRMGAATLDIGSSVVEVRGEVPVGPEVLGPGAMLHRALAALGDVVVVVPDVGGLGWAVLTARAQGLLTADQRVVVYVGGPSVRLRAEADRPALTFADAVVDRLESEVLGLADAVVAGSADAAAWIASTGPSARAAGRTTGTDLEGAVDRLLDAPPAGGSSPSDVRSGPEPVTAVVTHYERPAFARRAIDSLLAQRWPDLKVIVVDDGSTSAEALAFLDELERRTFSRPLSVLRQDNRGLGAARNAALRAAGTAYVAFLDDDDEAEPDYVGHLVSAARSTGAAAAVAGFGVHHDSPTGPLIAGREQLHWLFFSPAADLAAIDNIVGGAAALFRRADALAVGGFHERRGVAYEDWHLLVRLVLAGHRVTAVPEPLVRYRVAPTGMLQTYPRRASHEAVLEAFAASLPPVLHGWPALQLGLHAQVQAHEAALARSAAKVEELEAQARAHVEELERLRAVEAHRDALLASTTWRVGRRLVGPAERLRRRGRALAGGRRRHG
jgi:GT2 family glycosyltransferase